MKCSSISKPQDGSVLHNTLFRGKLEKASSFEGILDGKAAGFPGLWLVVLRSLSWETQEEVFFMLTCLKMEGSFSGLPRMSSHLSFAEPSWMS